MKIAVLFPGYGSQYVGMGKELYDQSRIMQEYFEEASTIVNVNFVKLCFASSDSEIGKIENALPAMFLVSASLYASLKDQEGLIPEVITGHTSGFYAAMFAAGGINFPDMLYLIQKYVGFYREVLDRIPTKAIRVVGLDTETVLVLCKSVQDVHNLAVGAVYESEKELIVAGHQSAVDSIHEQVIQYGAKKVIEVPQIEGLHSPIMQSVVEHIRLYSEKVDFKDLQVPLMINGQLIQAKDEVKQAMFDYVINPINWYSCVQKLSEYDILIEIGPGSELSAKMRKLYPEKAIVAINKESDIQALHTLLSANSKMKSAA